MNCVKWVPLLSLLVLSACDERSADQKAAQEAGKPMEISAPVHVATSGPFEIYRVSIPQDGGSETLWVVSGGTVKYNCGKNCEKTVANPSITGLSKLTAEESAALHLPPAADPRITGLAKLTPEEKHALGLEQAERELLQPR